MLAEIDAEAEALWLALTEVEALWLADTDAE